ncbi:putative maintenance of ploidy protein mob1 [Venturia nashicola]|nr:putative maintenance of ploidy protein mob1 [Venturia nashicola]
MFDIDSDPRTPLLRVSTDDILASAGRDATGKAVETSVTEDDWTDTASSTKTSQASQTGSAVTATRARHWSASAATGPPIIRDGSTRDRAGSETRRGITFDESTARDGSAGDSSTAVGIPSTRTSGAAKESGSSSAILSGDDNSPNWVPLFGNPNSAEYNTSLSGSTLVASTVQTDGTTDTAVEGNHKRRRPMAITRTTTCTHPFSWRGYFSNFQNHICTAMGLILTVVLVIGVFALLLRGLGFGFHSDPYLGRRPHGIGRDHPRDFKDEDGCREKLVCREPLDLYHKTPSLPYCQDRQQFLEAMSEGKRLGLDAPYYPRGCHYHWFDTNHICEILHRFDGLAIVGDTNAKEIFAGLTTLVREDYLWGASRLWDIPDPNAPACSCDGQFSRPICEPYLVNRSTDVVRRWVHRFDVQQTPIGIQPSRHRGHGKYESSYQCDLTKTPMIYEPVKSDTNGWLHFPRMTLRRIQRAMPGAELKKIPIIFTLDSLHHQDIPQWVISTYLKEWAHQLPQSHLWVNPGVNYETEQLVQDAGGETLTTWNMTARATQVRHGWYGQRVGLVQAMMVLNWLDMLEV